MDYWVSCEKYVYYRMKVKNCKDADDAEKKAGKMIENGEDEKWIDKYGDGDTEILGVYENEDDI